MKLLPGAARFYRMEIPENPECRFFTAGTGIRMSGNRIGAEEAVEKGGRTAERSSNKRWKITGCAGRIHVAPTFFRNVLRSFFSRIRTARNVASAGERLGEKIAAPELTLAR